jgi:transglutaminase-like putative cysteine protease
LKQNLTILLVAFFTIAVTAQKIKYSATQIADSLLTNSNAVVRLNHQEILISSQRKMTIYTNRVVTVYNKNGLSAVGAITGYDKSRSLNAIEAVIYDAFGNEIKKIRKKDFIDESAVSGGTLFSDSRVVYLDYTPINYPFTVNFTCEIQTSNTALIPKWMPITDYYVSIEKSILKVTYPNDLGFKKKEFNLDSFNVKKTSDTSTQLSYAVEAVVAQKPEELSPDFIKIYPRVIMSLEFFNLEGVDGSAKNWKEYGQWFSEKILKGTCDLSDETIAKIKSIVGVEKDPIKKAKIVYQYLQNKSRYISVQVGIGGFKPMLASDVDRLSYGDCKALSNYTRALLNAVDVPAYYTELYGDSDKIDIESDFFSVQGNHVILAIPNQKEYVFLECTSQDNPFGFQANFTDDRNVVVIKPEGGEIVRTKDYDENTNSQFSKGQYSISETGDFEGGISIVSEGTQYQKKYQLEKLSPTEKERNYKNYWSNINNLNINNTSFFNDKEKISFTENVQISAVNYGAITGNKILFAVNAFNQYSGNLKKSRNRHNPFEIERGFVDNDEITITLPSGFLIEAMPENIELSNKFGNYKMELVKKDGLNIVYKRKLLLKKGIYSKEEFEEFRMFIEKVRRNDNSKIVIAKI